MAALRNGQVHRDRVTLMDLIQFQREGKGVHTFADGGMYTGMFKEGKRHGWGRRVYADGRIYEGMFQSNRLLY